MGAFKMKVDYELLQCGCDRAREIGLMKERRLRRALWLARAMRGRDNSILLPSRYMRKVWDNVESKCRAMAEKFK
jgi:hypothetical protein